LRFITVPVDVERLLKWMWWWNAVPYGDKTARGLWVLSSSRKQSMQHALLPRYMRKFETGSLG